MAARYLLDTNVISDFVRGDEAVRARLHATAPSEIAVSTISVMEIDYGLALAPARAKKLRPALTALLDAVSVVHFTSEDARAAAAVRAAQRRLGRPVGPYDVLLAGTALARGQVLVTANEAEFSRISGLLVENWRV
jgi:tRNA(fMet)-specific endonuclease VapC